MAAVLLMPSPEAALIGRERVGDDGRGVGEEHGPADSLADAHRDEPDGSRRAGQPRHGEQERERREDDEAEVEDLDPAEDVPDAAEGDHEHGQHHAEAHQHPEQVAGVARA